MDPGKQHFDWNHARAFLATAEAGSLSGAARALGLTQPTLGRQVSALEEELGLVLFERVGRGLVLTPAGARLREHVAAMRDAAGRVSLAAEGQAEDVEGRVAISASDIFAVVLLPDILRELRRIAPRLRIDIVATNALSDLQRREADIAIRHVRPEAPTLIARKLGTAHAHIYGAARYLDQRGRPASAEALSGHDIIGFEDPERFIGYMEDVGVALRVDQFPFASANGLVCWELVKAGLGLTVMDDQIAARTDQVERLLPALTLPYPIWLTTHRELHTSPRIRLVFDHLAQAITALLPTLR